MAEQDCNRGDLTRAIASPLPPAAPVISVSDDNVP